MTRDAIYIGSNPQQEWGLDQWNRHWGDVAQANGIAISKTMGFWVAKMVGVCRLPLFGGVWVILRQDARCSIMTARNRDNPHVEQSKYRADCQETSRDQTDKAKPIPERQAGVRREKRLDAIDARSI